MYHKEYIKVKLNHNIYFNKLRGQMKILLTTVRLSRLVIISHN